MTMEYITLTINLIAGSVVLILTSALLTLVAPVMIFRDFFKVSRRDKVKRWLTGNVLLVVFAISMIHMGYNHG